MFTDGRTDTGTDDRQKVISTAHPEHSSGELKISFFVMLSRLGYKLHLAVLMHQLSLSELVKINVYPINLDKMLQW